MDCLGAISIESLQEKSQNLKNTMRCLPYKPYPVDLCSMGRGKKRSDRFSKLTRKSSDPGTALWIAWPGSSTRVLVESFVDAICILMSIGRLAHSIPAHKVATTCWAMRRRAICIQQVRTAFISIRIWDVDAICRTGSTRMQHCTERSVSKKFFKVINYISLN